MRKEFRWEDVVTEPEEVKEVWKLYFENLLNEEFDWNRDSLESVNLVDGPVVEISLAEVRSALLSGKVGKAAGPSGLVLEMIKASGEAGLQWLTDLFNAVVRDGRIPDDWRRSWMVTVYKGKGDALECGSYRGIKLLEQAMKVLERVIERRVREKVNIDNMQFGFRPKRSTTDAIFIVRQLQEKFLAKGRDLWLAFVDLEKAFDRVPREVLWWALRSAGVDEWIVNVIKAMYAGACTSVKLQSDESAVFDVNVGVHQGSVLSPLLFIIVLEELSKRFRVGLPWELLYADDLVLVAETEEELLGKIRSWKLAMEEKGLRVNLAKTKVMKCGKRVVKQVVDSAAVKWPCGVCGKGVGSNSVKCNTCDRWVHKVCSGIKGKLKSVKDFKCSSCVSRKSRPESAVEEGCELTSVEEGRELTSVKEKRELVVGVDGSLEFVDSFCYLGDMLGSGGGAEDASKTRVRCAWAKFRELAPILTLRGASLRLKGKIYSACVQSVLVYASETWPMKVEDLTRLERTERMMVRWMCGVTLKDRICSMELLDRLGIECVSVIVRRSRLRWFGHVERLDADNWVSSCRDLNIVGVRKPGRGKKTWFQCVREDMRELGLKREDAQKRSEWSGTIRENRLTRASADKSKTDVK